MVKLKIGRSLFAITDTDVVLYNGTCWQLITQVKCNGWDSYHPVLSQTLVKKLLKNNCIYMVKKEREYISSGGKQMGLYYYKFDLDNLLKMVSSESQIKNSSNTNYTYPSSEAVNNIRQLYPKGTKVRLIKMDDVQAPPKGTIGIVRSVDDIGTIHISWETGSSLGVIYGEDMIEIVK